MEEDLKLRFDLALIKSKIINESDLFDMMRLVAGASKATGHKTLFLDLPSNNGINKTTTQYRPSVLFWSIVNYFIDAKFDPITELAMLIKFLEIQYQWDYSKDEDVLNASYIVFVYETEKQKVKQLFS